MPAASASLNDLIMTREYNATRYTSIAAYAPHCFRSSVRLRSSEGRVLGGRPSLPFGSDKRPLAGLSASPHPRVRYNPPMNSDAHILALNARLIEPAAVS